MVTETSAMAVIRASQPSFRNPHDKIAFALHSSFLAAGYALTATGMRAYAEEVLPASHFRNPPRRPGSDTHPDLEHFRGTGFPDYI